MLKPTREAIRFQRSIEKAAQYNREELRREEHEQYIATKNFPDRVDKTILWPVYSKNSKLFSQYSLKKFSMKKHGISPFLNKSDVKNDILLQKLEFKKQMERLEKANDYYNMIFKEIDEDDSEEEDLF